MADLNTIAKKHKVTLDHVKSVLKGNKVSNPVLADIISIAKKNKNNGMTFPDWRIRKKGIDFNQSYIDFFPSEIADKI
nr:MAG TPA: hypothetical protein [Caudoviricetes sp.]